MDIEEARAFVATHHRGVLSCTRGDGKPQLSPVLAVTDGEGRIVVSSRETAYKTRNLMQRPWAALCVFSDGWQGPWVQIEGRVEVLHLPEAMEPLVDYYRRAAGETDWDEYRRRMVSEKRALLRISVERAGPKVSG